MAYDSARGVTVLVGGDAGGAGSSIYNNQVWEWNGTAWTSRPIGPSARHRHAMAYDSARGVTVLFGGYTNGASVRNGETWEWNGNTWTQRVVTGPSARASSAMAEVGPRHGLRRGQGAHGPLRGALQLVLRRDMGVERDGLESAGDPRADREVGARDGVRHGPRRCRGHRRDCPQWPAHSDHRPGLGMEWLLMGSAVELRFPGSVRARHGVRRGPRRDGCHGGLHQ